MKEKLLRVLSALLGISAVIAAAGLIYETALIYSHKSDGAQVYTYARIRAAFGEIALPVWIFIGFAAVMLIVTAVFPRTNSTKPDTDTVYESEPMHTYAPESHASGKERSIQKCASFIEAAAIIICILALSFLAFSQRYFASNDLETEIAGYMPVFAAISLTALSVVFASQIVKSRSLKRCRALLRISARPGACVNSKAVLAARLLILCTALIFTTLGIINGGLYDVFVKAINICTECIGLG